MLSQLREFFSNKQQLASLRRDVDALRDQWKKVEMDWNEWFDRFRRLHARIAKRQQREESSSEETAQALGLSPETAARISGLTPAQARLQAQIEQRRAGGRPPNVRRIMPTGTEGGEPE